MYFGHDIEFTKHALIVQTTTEISIQVRSSNIIRYAKHLSLCKTPGAFIYHGNKINPNHFVEPISLHFL